MSHRTIRLTALLLILATGAHGAEKPVLSLTMRYTDARNRMIEAGFRPFRVIPQGSDLFKRNFASREDIGRHFPEAAKCELKGKSRCYFLFARGPNEVVAIMAMGASAESLIVWKAQGVTAQEADELYRTGASPMPMSTPPNYGGFRN